MWLTLTPCVMEHCAKLLPHHSINHRLREKKNPPFTSSPSSSSFSLSPLLTSDDGRDQTLQRHSTSPRKKAKASTPDPTRANTTRGSVTLKMPCRRPYYSSRVEAPLNDLRLLRSFSPYECLEFEYYKWR